MNFVDNITLHKKVAYMTTLNNKPSSKPERQLNKRPKAKESLSFATWVLLIISFTLLAYALYVIQTRIL